MEELQPASPTPFNKHSQPEKSLIRLYHNESSSDDSVIEELRESNLKLKESLKALQDRHQKLLESSNNTAFSENAKNEATTDSLDQLSSKTQFISEIDARIINSSRYTIVSTLIVFHVNSIIDFESGFGMSKVNLMLKKIKLFLKNIIKKPYNAARMDNHLFALLLDDCNSNESVKVASFIKNKVNRYTPSSVKCTIGIAPVNANVLNAEDLLFQTEIKPPSTLEVKEPTSSFTTQDSLRTSARDMMERLMLALHNERFKPLFQPLVNLKENNKSAYEVFIRISDTNGQHIPAEEFVPLAYLNNLGEALDKALIQQALKHVQENGQVPHLLVVTITNNSLTSPTFLNWLDQHLQLLNIEPSFLTLQISEIDIYENLVQSIKFCNDMDKLGFRKAICHFDCSKNSQNYLDAIRADYIKLDKNIFCDINYKIRQKNQLRDIINNLHHKGYKVMAPQIENINMLPALWKIGFDFVQGYCLQEPRESMQYPFIQEIDISVPAPQYGASH